MKKVKEIADYYKIAPKLRLGTKLVGGGVKTTGPHKVKFTEEPTVVMGKDDKGQPRKEMKFLVEEKGVIYRWNVPILNKEGQPNYLIERLMNIEVGDERILEMHRERGRNYIDVRLTTDEAPEEPEEEDEKIINLEDEIDEGNEKV
jgi:hypothetical protein